MNYLQRRLPLEKEASSSGRNIGCRALGTSVDTAVTPCNILLRLGHTPETGVGHLETCGPLTPEMPVIPGLRGGIE